MRPIEMPIIMIIRSCPIYCDFVIKFMVESIKSKYNKPFLGDSAHYSLNFTRGD